MSLAFSYFFSSELPFPFNTDLPFWEALSALQRFFANQVPSHDPSAAISSKAELIHPEKITICSGAKIESGAQIVGPAYIGPDTTVSHGALVRAQTVLLEGSIVGHCSEVKRSILLPHAKAAHFNYVGDSIIGSNVNLGAGAILCNLRLDKQQVRIEGHTTGMLKLGAAIGDGAAIGAGVICNPGALIEQGACVCLKTIVTGRFSREIQLQ